MEWNKKKWRKSNTLIKFAANPPPLSDGILTPPRTIKSMRMQSEILSILKMRFQLCRFGVNLLEKHFEFDTLLLVFSWGDNFARLPPPAWLIRDSSPCHHKGRRLSFVIVAFLVDSEHNDDANLILPTTITYQCNMNLHCPPVLTSILLVIIHISFSCNLPSPSRRFLACSDGWMSPHWITLWWRIIRTIKYGFFNPPA